LGCAFPDRQASAALDVKLHVGACPTLPPYLEAAGDAPRQQGAARIEDRISAPLDQGLAGKGDPIAPAVFGQSDRLELNPYRPQGLLLDRIYIRLGSILVLVSHRRCSFDGSHALERNIRRDWPPVPKDRLSR
jgi:hypothetical protein